MNMRLRVVGYVLVAILTVFITHELEDLSDMELQYAEMACSLDRAQREQALDWNYCHCVFVSAHYDEYGFVESELDYYSK